MSFRGLLLLVPGNDVAVWIISTPQWSVRLHVGDKKKLLIQRQIGKKASSVMMEKWL